MASSELTAAVRIQGRVIWALILREVKSRYQGYRLGYFWALIEPCLHIGGWMVAFVILRQKQAPVGDSVVTFLATGLVPFIMFSTVANFVTQAMRANRPLLSYPIVQPLDLMVSRWLLESATLIVVATIIFTFLIMIGQSRPPDDLPLVILASICQFSLALGLGVFNAVITQMWSLYDYIWDLVSRLLYFTSGIFFLVDTMPQIIQYYMWFNPVSQGLTMFRDGYFGDFKSHYPSPAYMLFWAFTLLFIGLFFERRTRGRKPGD